jgi:apolipoprotein N-acyltransferase
MNAVIRELETRLRQSQSRRLPEGGLPRSAAESGPPVTAVMGSLSIELFPEATYPKQKKFNSALVYDRDGVQRRERYDKIHLVPFGEVVPFRNARLAGFDLHWLYRLLNSLSPFSDGGKAEYSLWPGERLTVFQVAAAGRTWRFGTPICYEDVMPYLVRDYVWGGGERRVDFLLSISNDGWFLHSAELPQHLAACVFRAVENRVGIARAVNTGISGFIDPSGAAYSLVQRDGVSLGAGIVGFSVDRVRVDQRASLYGRSGDWFASLCLVATALLWLGAILTRWVFAIRRRWVVYRNRRRAAPAKEASA